jgi:L-lactate dehydrogenase
VIPQIVENAPDTVIVVATNPVDIMTHLTARIAVEQGMLKHRVLGSGTTLDTARFRALLGRHLGVDSYHIHAYVLGEHGDSEVLSWSIVGVGGIPLETFLTRSGATLDEAARQQIDQGVRRAAYHIINGKGATYYGIGSALARIVDVILHDQRSIMTVCAPMDTVVGVEDVTIAMPRMVQGSGVGDLLPVTLSEEETRKLGESARVVKHAIESLK